MITAGTAIRQTLSILNDHNAQAVGVVVALDRQEVGKENESEKPLSAVQQARIKND